MNLEGRVTIAVHWDGQQVIRGGVRSTRPRQPGRVLIGRSPAEAVATVPLLFSLCGRAQAVAAAMACERAAGAPEATAIAAARRVLVAAETIHEHAWRILIEWPSSIDEAGDVSRLAAVRRILDRLFRQLEGALAFSPAYLVEDVSDDWEDGRRELRGMLADSGSPFADAWIDDATAIHTWITASASPAARVLRGVRDASAAYRPRTVPLMPPKPPEGLAIELARALDHDADVAAAPTAQGEALETGPLARWHSCSLLRQLDRGACPVLLRLAARLVELEALLAPSAALTPAPRPAPGAAPRPPARLPLGSVALADGEGLAWVETARGLLVHRVCLDARGAIGRYDIVAPTEWNLHPRGALATELPGLRAADEPLLRRRVSLLAQSLDPCVGFTVSIGHA